MSDDVQETKPILNVVSTINSEKSSQLKWQINNFGVFLSSTAAFLYQNFEPAKDVKFELHLSKRKSTQNNEDKLELALKNINFLNDKKVTAQLKGQICMKNGEKWLSNFVLDFSSTKTHLFATPCSSFDPQSVLVFDNMFYEQIFVETDILNSWIMSLDDPCIMSNSITDLINSETIQPIQDELQSLSLEQSSVYSENEIDRLNDEDEKFFKSLDVLINCQEEDELAAILAYNNLYAKLREVFESFSSGVPTNKTSFKPEKSKFVKLHVFVAYLERLLNKIASYEESMSIACHLECYLQSQLWFETHNVNGSNFPFHLKKEIREFCKQSKDFKLIQSSITKLWDEFTNENVDTEIKLQWIKHIESKIEVLRNQIENLKTESSKLLICPMKVAELNELKAKLTEQQSKITESLKFDSEIFVQKKKNEMDLDELRRILNDMNTKFVMFPEFCTSNDRVCFIRGIKRRLEIAKTMIKSLDRRIVEPRDCYELDNLKNFYDGFLEKLTNVEFVAKEQSKFENFKKAVESIHQLQSNISYTMKRADSNTLMNYEVELCKCLSELEITLQVLRDSESENDTTRIHYKDAKVKADWIANELRDRLMLWREFIDLYSSIEASHKSISEIIGQLNSKGRVTDQEACKDVEILDSIKMAFEDCRKDMVFIRHHCSSGHMQSMGLAAEAAQKLKKINESHKRIDVELKVLMFKLKNPFTGYRHKKHSRRHGGSSYEPF